MPRTKKTEINKTETRKKPKAKIKEEEKYFEAVGRRKTSVARARLYSKGDKEILINEKPYKSYFPALKLQRIIVDALEKMKCLDKFRAQILVKGGGFNSQAEAVRHAISRALVLFNADFKKRLRNAGYLTRDPRMRERKKFGLKRARRAPQWQKR
jgi:small subunit ribosomal protein S9